MKKMKIKIIEQILDIYTTLTRRKKDVIIHDEMSPSTIVIYSTTALGDYLFNTPAIKYLRDKFPKAKLILVTSEKNHHLVKQYDWYDDILVWDNKIVRIIPLLLKLKRRKPDFSVILHSHFPYDIFCSVLSGSKLIFRDHYGSESSKLNKYLDNYSGYYEGHTIKRKLKLFEDFGANLDDTKMHLPGSYSDINKQSERRRIGFQLGASSENRRWPLALFGQLACMLLDKADDMDIIIIGTKAEKSLSEEFLTHVPNKYRNNIITMTGKTNLTELITLVKSLDILVTGDTGPLHIAIAAGIKTVSLFATANPSHTGPCQDHDRHKVIHRPDCKEFQHPMMSIVPNDAFDAITALIERGI